MKKLTITNSTIAAAAFSLVFSLAVPIAAQAATAPSLGATSPYGVAADNHTNANTGLQTIINGSDCATTHVVPLPLTITGTTDTPCDPQVGIDQGAALNNVVDGLNTQTCTPIAGSLDAVIIGPNAPGTFPPGCYAITGAMNITLSTTVTLDLTAPSGTGNVWVFKSSGALTTGNNSFVALANGASASNVFWAPVGLATLGAYTTGGVPPASSTFVGNILDAAGITMGHFANLLGRALAFGGTVTTDANTITVPSLPATLHVIKLVVNGNGGTAIPGNFTIHVNNASGTDVSGSPQVGTSTPGTSYSLGAGTYTVNENNNSLYVKSFTGDCDVNGSITLTAGQNKICTIVNTDIPAPVSAPSIDALVPLIGILKVPTPLSLPAGPGPVTYNYTVWNVAAQQALTSVSVTDDKCSPLIFVSGDTNQNGKLDIAERWHYSCTMTLSQTTTNTAIAIGHADDSTNQTAIATALATVAVGAAPVAPTSSVPLFPNTGGVPPLINIVKVPSRLTPFPSGGGPVIYTYAVTNPGVVPMRNVSVTDDHCAPVSGPLAGDVNGNGLLDPGETWGYACRTQVSVSTRNIATAKGDANGFTALGYAFATVLVAIPGLPNTGFPPVEHNALPALLLVLMFIAVVALFGMARKGHTVQ